MSWEAYVRDDHYAVTMPAGTIVPGTVLLAKRKRYLHLGSLDAVGRKAPSIQPDAT